MRKKYFISCFIIITIISGTVSLVLGEQQPEDKKITKKISKEIVSSMVEKFTKSCGIETKKKDGTLTYRLSEKQEKNKWGKDNFVYVISGEIPEKFRYTMKINAESGILESYHKRFESSHETKNAVKSGNVTPKTKDEIAVLGQKYLEIFEIRPQEDIGLKLKEIFLTSEQDEYVLTWYRTYNDYEFKSEGVVMYLDSITGDILSINNIYEGVAKCPTEVKITKEEAIEIARKEWGGARREGNYVLVIGTVESAELKIVHPNYFWKYHEFRNENRTRLAWVIIFTEGHRLKEKEAKYDSSVLFYIDASTGEVLGGDYSNFIGWEIIKDEGGEGSEK